MRQSVSTQRGLTILEMLGVIAISTILLSGAWQLFQGGMRSYQRGLQDVRMTQGARALFKPRLNSRYASAEFRRLTAGRCR